MAGKCRKMNDMMSPYIDGTLTEKQKRQFLEHIAACEGCRDSFNELKYIISLAGEIEPVEPPEDLKLNIMREIRKLETGRKDKGYSFRSGFFARAVPVLAASFAVVFFVYLSQTSGLFKGLTEFGRPASDMAAAENYADETEDAKLSAIPERGMGIMAEEYVLDISVTADDIIKAEEVIYGMLSDIRPDIENTVQTENIDKEKEFSEIYIDLSFTEAEKLAEKILNEYPDSVINSQISDKDGSVRISINRKQ